MEGVNMMRDFGLLVVFVLGVATAAETGLTLISSLTTVPVGGTFTLTCHVPELTPNTVTFNKAEDDVKLSTNHVMETNFANVERYFVNYSNPDGNVFDFFFHVKNAHIEDSGNYTCGIQGDVGDMDTVEVNVAYGPDALKFYVRNDSEAEMIEVDDGFVLELHKNEKHELKCEVEGANPEPEVSIKLGDNDITDDFDKEVMIIRTPTTVDGLKTIDRKVTLNKNYNIECWKFDQKNVTCSASVPGSTDAIKSRTFKIKFKEGCEAAGCSMTLASLPLLVITAIWWLLQQ